MKVIDKRTENKDENWQVGDGICYYTYETNKHYGMIVGPDSQDRYYIAFLDGINPGVLSDDGIIHDARPYGATSINNLIEMLISSWSHVEKINAHLVVED